MAAELLLFRLHWAKPAVKTDADQEVAPVLGILRYLRRNQWIVFCRESDHEETSYFPFKKAEIEDRLEAAQPLDLLTETLDLRQSGAKRVRRRSWGRYDTEESDPSERSVWIDDSGALLGIGVPTKVVDLDGQERSESSHERQIMVRHSLAASAESVVYRDRISGDVLDFGEAEIRGNLSIDAERVRVKKDSPGNQVLGDKETIVSVYYGTNREVSSGASSLVTFSGQRALDGNLRFGVCSVSIPPSHKTGVIESPKWWKLWERPQPSKHLILLSTTQLTEFDFLNRVASVCQRASRGELFVFIHGYNVDFDTAALRTAQLAFDLSLDGAPIMFSWPSKGRVLGYAADEGSAEWSKPHLQDFFQKLSNKTPGSAINVIAHSMGNRALLNMVRSLQVSVKFNQLILAAPDIDSGIFRQLAKDFPLVAKQVTLYASSKDKALCASRKIHGYSRAGEAGDNLVVVNGVDTIDASSVDTDFLGHSSAMQERSIISDIFSLLRHGDPPQSRFGLKALSTPNGTYWDFRR